jgi:hypothetical protein
MDFKNIDPAKVIFNRQYRNEFIEVYNATGLGTLKPCNNCNGAFENAIIKYQNMFKNQEKKYLLKNNKVLQFKGKDYVNANLTDEVAAEAVAAGYQSFFLKIPLEGEEQVILPNENLTEPKKRKRK